ncbi:AAA family ATPase [bacterium]|nr:AAA family ATPase [bacterium]
MLDVFITSSEANQGKTFVTAGISSTLQSLGYSTSVYAPVHLGGVVRDGFLEAPDLLYIKNSDNNIKTYYSYLLQNDKDPIQSAEEQRIRIVPNTLFEDYQEINNRFECLITLGTKGIQTPIAPNFTEIDLVKLLGLPLIFVISPTKVKIDDILIMANQAYVQRIPVRGIIFVDCPLKTEDANLKNLPKLIEKYADTRVIGAYPSVENIYSLTPDELISYTLSGVNLEMVFGTKIPKLSF